jgi:thioredoxin reductase
MTATAVDVAVIGGGPAGLAAATELRLRGIEGVVVFDRETVAGGVPRLCRHSLFGLVEFWRVMSGPSYAERLVEKALASGVRLLTRHSVFELGASGSLRVATPEGTLEVHSKKVIIATGAREASRAARFLSGDRPMTGCLTTGALQSILQEHDEIPFRHPLVLGTEFVSLSAIWTCRSVGIQPLAVIEELPQPIAGKLFGFLSRRLGIPVFLGAKIAEIRGNRQVESVVVRLQDGSLKDIACDGLLCTGHFVPEAGILHTSQIALDPETRRPLVDQFGRCSSEAYYAVGNVSHTAQTAGFCYREGRRIGRNVAEDLLGRLAKR